MNQDAYPKPEEWNPQRWLDIENVTDAADVGKEESG